MVWVYYPHLYVLQLLIIICHLDWQQNRQIFSSTPSLMQWMTPPVKNPGNQGRAVDMFITHLKTVLFFEQTHLFSE